MENFTYTDIFATKGIEYILVIGYLIILIFFWRSLNSPKIESKTGVAKSFSKVRNSWFQLVEDYFFHQGHSWAAPENTNVVKVGIDDFASKMLGPIDAVKVPGVGDRTTQGEKCWQLIIDGNQLNMLSPVNGEVIAVNEKALQYPKLISADPYNKGWLMKIKVNTMKADLRNLLSGTLAIAWIEDIVEKLREKFYTPLELGTVMQDGGIPVSGFIKNISPNNWAELAEEFLLTD